MISPPSVIRYVGTYLIDDGRPRRLIGPAQGCLTFETYAEAQTYIDAVTSSNGSDTIRQVWGDNPRFEVRPCPCYPAHFDPQTCWFD